MKRIIIDYVGFKKVILLDLEILTEIRFFPIKILSARLGLVHS
jgi:hypothetical protein